MCDLMCQSSIKGIIAWCCCQLDMGVAGGQNVPCAVSHASWQHVHESMIDIGV